MKNKLSDLNDHLFAQLERLSEEGLSAEQIELEAKRAEAIVAVADQVIGSATIQVAVARLIADRGGDPMSHLLQLEGRPNQKQISDKRQ